MNLNKIYKHGLLFVISNRYGFKFSEKHIDNFELSNSSIPKVCNFLDRRIGNLKPKKKEILEFLGLYSSPLKNMRFLLRNNLLKNRFGAERK